MFEVIDSEVPIMNRWSIYNSFMDVDFDVTRILLLQRLSLFTASFNGAYMHGILNGCLRNIDLGNRPRLTVVEQELVVEAAHATSVILRWAGEHHKVMLELGIFRFVVRLMLGEKQSSTNDKIWVTSIRSLSWEIIGYLAAHFNSSTTWKVLSGIPAAGPGLGAVTVTAWSVHAHSLCACLSRLSSLVAFFDSSYSVSPNFCIFA